MYTLFKPQDNALSLSCFRDSVEFWGRLAIIACVSFYLPSKNAMAEGQQPLQEQETVKKKWPEPLPQDVQVNDHSDGKMREAKKLLQDRKWSEALIGFRSVLKEEPSRLEAILGMTRALAYLGRREEALRFLNDAHSKAPSEKKPYLQKRIEVLSHLFLSNQTYQTYQEGVNLLREGKVKPAKKKFELAASKEPDHGLILLRLSQSEIQEKDYDAASEKLRFARRLNPFDSAVRMWLGRALIYRGEAKQAIVELTEAQKQLKKSESIPVWLAEAWVAIGERDAAISILEQDIQKNPLHLKSILKLSRLKYLAIPPVSEARIKLTPAETKNLWEVKKYLQLALSRVEAYQDYQEQLVVKVKDSEDIEKKSSREELKSQIQVFLKSVEERIAYEEN